MKSRTSTNVVPYLFPFVLLIAGWFVFGPIGGRIGQDYYREIPRMISGSLHFWQNGFAVPHYVASFCGGIPLFADPQSSYYSLPQVLAFWWDPLVAIRVAILVFYVLGYFFTFLWFRRALSYGSEVSHFGALLFVLNGFIFGNLFVGHLTHHAYLLCPALLYFLCKEMPQSWRRRLADACLFGLVWIYTVYSGGFHMLVLFGVLTALAVPVVCFKRPLKESLQWLGILCGALIAALLLICSSKLVAIWRYSPHFFRMPFNLSPENPWFMAFRYFWESPWDTASMLPFGKYSFGVWEFLGFISKITLLAPLYFLVRICLQPKAKEILFFVSYLLVIAFLCLLATGNGGNAYLPFFKMYHNPIKLFGAIVPFLIWLSVSALQDLTQRAKWLNRSHWRIAFFALLSIGVCVEEWDYFNYYVANRTGLDYTYDPQIYTDLQQRGTLPPIERVEATLGADSNAARGAYSSLACYEPLFGYRLEGLLTQVRPGSVFTITDGKFNMNQPGCLLYPEFYHCQPWDRVKESDGDALKKFLMGDSSAWPVPLWHNALITLNVLLLSFWIFFPTVVLMTPLWTASPAPSKTKKRRRLGRTPLARRR